MAPFYECHKGGFQGTQATVQSFGQRTAAGAPGGTGAQALGGVKPALGDPLAYSLVSGRKARVKAGRYDLPASNPDYGMYHLILPTDQTWDHTAADSSQARTDLLVAVVKNTGIAADDYQRIAVVEGVPGAGVPALPSGLSAGNVDVLWQVTMPAGGPSTALTGFVDKRKWAPIGQVTVAGAAATPSLAAYLPPGTPVWDPTVNRLFVRDSGTGLVRDVPMVGMRHFAGDLDVPSGSEFDMGTLTGVGSDGAQTAAFGDAYLQVHVNNHDLQILTAGLYSVTLEVLMASSNSTGVAKLKVDDTMVMAAGFDSQGRANLTKPMILSVGARLNASFAHTSGTARNFAYGMTVTRLA